MELMTEPSTPNDGSLDEAFINEIDKTVYIIEKNFSALVVQLMKNSQHSHSKSENIDGF